MSLETPQKSPEPTQPLQPLFHASPSSKISNFSFNAKPNPQTKETQAPTDSQPEEEDTNVNYTIDFENEEEYNNVDVQIRKTKKQKRRKRYDKLSLYTQHNLEELNEELESPEFDYEQTIQKIQKMRFLQSNPKLEFEDFLELRSYYLGFCGDLPNRMQHRSSNKNIIIFNNFNNVVSLTLELGEFNFMMKPFYTPSKGEMVSCIRFGDGKHSNLLCVSFFGKSSVSVMDYYSSEKLFEVRLEEEQNIAVDLLLYKKQLFVLYNDAKLAIYEVKKFSY